MVVNPMVGFYIPIIRIPYFSGGMSLSPTQGVDRPSHERRSMILAVMHVWSWDSQVETNLFVTTWQVCGRHILFFFVGGGYVVLCVYIYIYYIIVSLWSDNITPLTRWICKANLRSKKAKGWSIRATMRRQALYGVNAELLSSCVICCDELQFRHRTGSVQIMRQTSSSRLRVCQLNCIAYHCDFVNVGKYTSSMDCLGPSMDKLDSNKTPVDNSQKHHTVGIYHTWISLIPIKVWDWFL